MIPEWPPRAMTLAETHVDWHRVQRHIDERRAAVERAGVGATRKIATSLALAGHVVESDRDLLAARLQAALDATAKFGYRSAQAEIRSLRGSRPMLVGDGVTDNRATLQAAIDTLALAYELPSIGDQAEVAAGGIDAVRALVRRRAKEAADRVVSAAMKAYVSGQPGLERQIALVSASRKALHRVVIELVGETLTQGRIAGALAAPGGPPEFALRSSMLDKNSCEPCDRLNGTVVQVGSGEFYDLSPPSMCLGSGRCRCQWVFGSTADQMQQPVAA